jgi:hypothetical protein
MSSLDDVVSSNVINERRSPMTGCCGGRQEAQVTTAKAEEDDGCGCRGPRRRPARTEAQVADEKTSQTVSEKSEGKSGCC